MSKNYDYVILLIDEYKQAVKCPSRIKEYFYNNYKNIYDDLIKTFYWTNSFKEIEFCLRYKIYTLPVCPCCGAPVKFSGKDNKPYNTYCSKSCYMSNKGQEIYWLKYTNTCNKKYGTAFYTLTNTFKNKRTKTYIQKYGTEFPLLTDVVKLHYKETCLKLYGVESVNLTLFKKELAKQTCIRKYGVVTNLNLPDIKLKAHTEEAINKGFDTYKRNHPHGKSKSEKFLYEYLLTIFDKADIKQLYKTKLYPYHCDFYILSIDLYIELNGHLSHGPHPFNQYNEEDIKLLNYWKSKDFDKHPSYLKYIDVWTNKDVIKRATANQNKLNYLEIFSIKETEIKETFINYVKLHKLNVNLGIDE